MLIKEVIDSLIQPPASRRHHLQSARQSVFCFVFSNNARNITMPDQQHPNENYQNCSKCYNTLMLSLKGFLVGITM